MRVSQLLSFPEPQHRSLEQVDSWPLSCDPLACQNRPPRATTSRQNPSNRVCHVRLRLALHVVQSASPERRKALFYCVPCGQALGCCHPTERMRKGPHAHQSYPTPGRSGFHQCASTHKPNQALFDRWRILFAFVRLHADGEDCFAALSIAISAAM